MTKEEISAKLKIWYLSWPGPHVTDYPTHNGSSHMCLYVILNSLLGTGKHIWS